MRCLFFIYCKKEMRDDIGVSGKKYSVQDVDSGFYD